MNHLDLFMEYLPFFLPLIILQLVLAITAVIHVLKHPQYRFGNKPMWIIIVLFVQIIGPVIYFVFGRGDSE
ncbi:PLD nuclease N-terminal domain-containing protein [Granulicatella sp. s8]|uniref:PLD nuclease N-terminal domain-containing protein n=2 Tax=Granulicatella seriolae TaxID=2967226 RepID=A0ABT1WN83_9LACT|nr:PLD nuclease N-terminal domain-containing protein [Granulicatella seriolae]